MPNPLHAAFAILAAVAHRERTGEGQEIAMAQMESTMATFPDAVMDFAANGRRTRAGEGNPGCGPHGVFRCAGDDRWCAIPETGDAAFAAPFRALGRAGGR